MGCCGSSERSAYDAPVSSQNLHGGEVQQQDDGLSRNVSSVPPGIPPGISPGQQPLGNASLPHSPAQFPGGQVRYYPLGRHHRYPPQDVSLTEHYNLPLRRHIWSSRSPITRAEIDRQREEFYDTRVSGRAEIWGTIRLAIETMSEGDLETAQGILDAAAITLPVGDLTNGVYDELGNRYEIPPYVASDPQNLSFGDDSPMAGKAIASSTAATVIEARSQQDGDDETSDEEAEIRRVEKGKMPVQDEASQLSVKARLSDREGQGDIIVHFSPDESVKSISRKVMQKAGVRNVKMFYLGKRLVENEPLTEQGWQSGHILNAMVFRSPTS